MLIRSMGCLRPDLCFLSVNASAKDRLPIRPQYIRRIRMILEHVPVCRVIPVVIPTVSTAEKVSNSTSVSGSPSTAQIRKEAVTARVRVRVSPSSSCWGVYLHICHICEQHIRHS